VLTDSRRYDEIRSLYIDQLAFIWVDSPTAETTQTNIEKKIDSFVDGDLKHGTEILSALWEIANKDGDIKAPSNTPPAVSPFRFCLPAGIMGECLLHVTRLRRSRAPPTGPL